MLEKTESKSEMQSKLYHNIFYKIPVSGEPIQHYEAHYYMESQQRTGYA